MTHRRRILLSAAVLAACVCIALGVLAVLPPKPGVTKANFDRVKNGMTLAEVEAILGSRMSAKNNIAGWYADDGAAASAVFYQDAAHEITWFESTETILNRIRRWLHLPK